MNESSPTRGESSKSVEGKGSTPEPSPSTNSESSWFENDEVEVVRISHLYECELCGEPAIDHAVVDDDPKYMMTMHGELIPFLHRMCDGRIVKL